MQANLFSSNPTHPNRVPPAFRCENIEPGTEHIVASITGPMKGKCRDVGAYWMNLSSFHKELRRSDATRAFAHARAYKYMTNNSTIKRYIHAIVMEETRDLDLMEYTTKELKGNSSDKWYHFVSRFLTSRKRWENPYSVEMERTMAIERASKATPRVGLHDFGEAVSKFEFLEDGYYLFQRALDGGEAYIYSFYINALKRLPPKPRKVFEDWVCDLRNGPNFNELQALVDFICFPELIELGSEPIMDSHRVDVSYDVDFYSIQPYGWDEHHYAGQKRLRDNKHNWKSVESDGQPEGLDIRWGAEQVGCSWRAVAYNKSIVDGFDDYRQYGLVEPFEGNEESMAHFRDAMKAQAVRLPKYFVYP